MIFLRINCSNAARHVASAVWAFEAVIGVSHQIEYDWFSILRYDMIDALYLRAPESWRIASLIFNTEPNQTKKE